MTTARTKTVLTPIPGADPHAMGAPTIEDRLMDIRKRFALLAVALRGDDAEGMEEWQPDAREALLDVIRAGYADLHALLQLPGAVLQTAAPDEEEIVKDAAR